MENEKLHIVMLPWLAFGHMIPYLELAKRLAQMGHRISFLSTPRNIDRLLPNLPHDLLARLNFVKLTAPAIEGLPEDAHSTNDVPFHQIPSIVKLQDGMEGPMRAFIQNNPLPDWIVYDIFHYWAPAVATDYGIPSALFSILNAMAHCFFGPPSAMLENREDPSPRQLTAQPSWIPFTTNVAWRYNDAVRHAETRSRIASVTGITINHRLGKASQGCHVAAVRSCIDIEPEWIPLLSQLLQKPVFPILLSPSQTESSTEIGEPSAVLEWLDRQKPESVVYVAFGSEWQFNRDQAHELAFGLERSELPFFWTYRGDPDLLPTGFEERTKGHGLVHMRWAPQRKLLAHKSIGCFLTHAGWGSTVEGLAFGKPLVMLPMFADQGLNALLMAEKRIGVEVPRNEDDGSFEADAVSKCLKRLMLEEEGRLLRSKALEMMKIFGNRKPNNEQIQQFVNHLIKNRRRNSVPGPLGSAFPNN